MLHEKDEEMEMNLKNEYSIISNLTHPNIVQAKNLLHTEKSSILIMEFLESYIPLKEFIDEKFPLSSSQSHSIFFQIIAAIVYLHDRKILHRDLHISNILINPVTEQIKIIDFGLSKRICQTYKSMDSLWTAASKLSSDDAFDFNTPTGLPSFRAPEILSNESWGFKVDVWMAGLILFALANKEYLTTVGVLKKMKGGDKFGNLEARMKMVLVGCLKRNPIERMSSKDVMAILSKNEEEFL